MNNCKERILPNLEVLRNISPQFKWLQHLNIDIQPTQTRKSRTICSKWSQTLPTLQALHVGEHDDPKSLHGTIVGPGPRKDTYLLKFLGLIPKWFGIPEFHRGRICQTSKSWGFNILVSRVCVFCFPLHQNEGPEKIWKPWTQTCKKQRYCALNHIETKTPAFLWFTEELSGKDKWSWKEWNPILEEGTKIFFKQLECSVTI